MTPGKTHHGLNVVGVASAVNAVGAMTGKPSRTMSIKT